MSVIWADGFEDHDYAAGASAAISTVLAGEFDAFGSGNATVSATGRRGGKALVANNSAAYFQKSLPAALTEIFVALAYYRTTATVANIVELYSAATLQVAMGLNADGSITVYRGATALGTSAAGLVPQSAYTQFQLRVVISDTVGVVQVRVNGSGSNAISVTGADTNNGAAAVSVNGVRFDPATGNDRWDDIVIWDTAGSTANTWLGDVRVDSYFPNANGDSSQFVGSDGNSTDNYLLVDGASPNGTDYVQSSTVNDKDLYGFTNLSHTPSSIFGVLVAPSALKDDAGSRSIRMLAKSGGTEVDSGADVNLSTTRTRYLGLFETDPNTSAAWTKAGLDAAQFGVKVTV